MLTRSLRGFAKLDVFSEAYAVCGGQNSVETNFFRVSDGLKVIRRERRLATGEENNDLAFWFKRNCSIKNSLRIFVSRLVNITNLVCIHEAGIAHHVAAVGKVDSQNGATTKLDV